VSSFDFYSDGEGGRGIANSRHQLKMRADAEKKEVYSDGTEA